MTKVLILGFFLCLSVTALVAQDVNTDSLLNEASKELSEHDLANSRHNLNSVIESTTENARAYLLRARVNLEEGLLEEALRDLTACINLDQDIIEAYQLRARLYNQLNYHRDYSIHDIDRAILLDKFDTENYVNKANYIVRSTNQLNRERDYQQAINVIDEAIAYDHENSRLYRIRADYKFEIGQRLGARTDIDRAIELDPNDPLNYDSRGTMRLFMEDFSGSFRDFTRAINLAPENERHYRKRAYAYYNSGRYEQAINDLSNTIELVLYRLDNNSISREEASSVLSNTYLIRGSALTQVDNYVEACSDFERARDLGARKASNYIARYCR